jgi:malate dehydrogenase (quinone)
MIENPDVILIGAGIMSATLGTVLKELEPTLNIVLFETLHDCALESSEGWNNAGTGHAANCELNYTPQRPDGSVDISKALEVNTEFDLSRQLWSFLVIKGAIPDPGAFINACPHMSFVWGRGQCRVPAPALQRDVRASLLSWHGIQRGLQQNRHLGASHHGRAG